jgi:hypothetical protein
MIMAWAILLLQDNNMYLRSANQKTMSYSHRTDIATRVEKRDSQTSFLKFRERGATVTKLDQAKLIADKRY